MHYTDKLKFSDFAKILKPYVSNGENGIVFVETLFTKITSDPNDSSIEEIDTVKNHKDSNWDSYFSGTRDITRFSPKIVKYIDIPKFATFVQNIGTDAKIQLASELKPYCKRVNEENVGEKAAELFKKIILEAARQPRKILSKNASQQMMNGDLDILRVEENLRLVINGLTSLKTDQIEKLRLIPIEIVNKIDEQNALLLHKVYSQISAFYYRVEELFKQIENIRGKKFKSIASVITGKYRKLSEKSLDQNQIFDSLVDWLKDIFPDASRIACEIIISFFVQNCEVFDELS